jgi:hypothetical protein
MKEFKKNQEDDFICEICGKTFHFFKSLSRHIGECHGDKKIYYDNYLKESNDGVCKICGSETKFKFLKTGYLDTCSRECHNRLAFERHRDGMFKKYGVDHNFKRKEVRQLAKKNITSYPFEDKKIQDKIKKGNIKKYGVENQFQREDIKRKIKEFNLENYGVAYYSQSKEYREKYKETIKKKYGCDHYSKTEEFKTKFKTTSNERYNADHPMQNIDIFNKQQMSIFKTRKFKNTDIYYTGSYELEFLEKFYDKIYIENGPSIFYMFNGVKKVYFSDFYIPPKNTIIEIKSRWVYNLQDLKKNKLKEKAAIDSGFSYLMIMEKDYSEFEKLLRKS